MIKKIQILREMLSPSLRLMSSLVFLAGGANADSCLPPPRPYVPEDVQAARDHAEIIRSDFERYIADIQSHFRCLDEERARAFNEAREVSEEYLRFLELMRR